MVTAKIKPTVVIQKKDEEKAMKAHYFKNKPQGKIVRGEKEAKELNKIKWNKKIENN